VLRCRVEPASPSAPTTPNLGSWQSTIDYLGRRTRGYIEDEGKLRRIETAQPTVEAVPVQAEILESSLLETSIGVSSWPDLHSAFLCSEMLLRVQTAGAGPVLARQATAPG